MNGLHVADDAAFGRRFRLLGPLLAGLLLAACQPGGDRAAAAVAGSAQPARIGAIQGTGARSPYVGQPVTVNGVVTGNFVRGLGGFFMQDESGAEDHDPATADGLFVCWAGDAEPTVRRGDRLRVRGTVAELGDGEQTQTALIDATVDVIGRAAVRATLVEQAPASDADWERLEGMWLRFARPLTVAGNYGLDRYGALDVSFDALPRSIGMRMPPGAPKAAARAARTAAHLFTLDDARDLENPQTLWFLPAPPTPEAPLRAGSRLFDVEGILDQRGPTRRLQLTAPIARIEQAPRPPAPPASDPALLRIGHFNVENFFNGDGDGGGFPTPRGAPSADDLARQQAKVVAMITGLAPDIASVVELENDGDGPDSAQQQLVDALNAALGADGDYRGVALPPDAAGDDAIRVGLIYRAGRVQPVGRAVQLVDGPFADRARPPLAQSFRPLAGGRALTAVAVHLKSKRCDDRAAPPAAGDREQFAGLGCWNALRTQSAQALADWLATRPTGVDSRDAIVLGDFNASTFEDPLVLLREAGWREAVEPQAKGSYTFIYRGLGNRLDHALLSPSLADRLQSALIWHINAAEAPLFGYDALGPLAEYRPDPYRASDHDPLLVLLKR